MRTQYILAALIVVVIGLALKQSLVPVKAGAEAARLRMDVMQMHVEHPRMNQLRHQRMQDLQTVFTPDE
jgi:hypothetical protein